MALSKVTAGVDAEISRVIARGRDSAASFSGRSTRLAFEDSNSQSQPQFLQVARTEWPPAIKELLGTVHSHSQMGFFTELKRTWLSIDNKLVLWNHVSGRDLCVYGGFSHLIVAVGDPVRPKPGVFRECISFIIPIASCDVVSLVGVQQKVEPNGTVSETRLFDLEFTVAAPCMLVKFSTDVASGGIFAAGADGNAYQVHYNRASTLLYPKMSLTAASTNGAVRASYNFIVSTLKNSLGARAASPLVDICFDARNQMVFTLNAANTIVGYERRGAKLSSTFRFEYESARAASAVSSQLVALYLGGSPNTIVAISEGGARIVFKVTNDAWTSSTSLQETGDTFPSPFSPHHVLTRSWYAEGIFVGSSCDASNPASSDAVVFVCDGVQGEPSVGFRALFANTECLRVEHICEFETPSTYADTIQQVMTAPRCVLMIHRKGVSVFMRLRPVDTLHLILESQKEERERRLAQFSSRCSSLELCAMLTQLASRNFSSVAFSPNFASSVGGMDAESSVRCLLTGPSSDISRHAIDVLRKYCLPTVEEKLRGSSRDIAIHYSPFVLGGLSYLSRLLLPVWHISPLLPNDNGLTGGNIGLIRSAELAVTKFISYLERCQGDLWMHSDSSTFAGGAVTRPEINWDRSSAKIEIPQTAMFAANSDSKIIQSEFIQSLLQFARAASQVLAFFLVCGRFERRVIDHFGKEMGSSKDSAIDLKSTIGKFVSNRADARKVARFIAKAVVQSSAVCPKEVTLLFEEMERDSPFLFDATDREEYDAVLQLTSILERSNASESSVYQILARTASISGNLYRSGALMPIINRLQQINMHSEAVSLCLCAASQLEGSLDEWERLMMAVSSLLERLFEFDRHAFNTIVGTPNTSGSMWCVRPSDGRSHAYLLSWLSERRADDSLTQVLRDTLVRVPSLELEGFLCRNIHELGLVYAEYLARIKNDFRAAVEVCSRLLQDPLSHIQPSERLSFRLQCSRKAVECALEGSAAQRTGAEHAMEALLLQTKLMGVVQRFLTSGSRALDELVPDNSGRTQRDLACQHLLLIQSEVVSQEKIFFLSLNYEVMDEALEIAMEALCLNRTFDTMVVSRLLQRVITHDKSLAEISRFVQRFGKRAGFPIISLILLAEHHQFLVSPVGSASVVKMLVDAGMEFDTIFNAYTEIIERRAVQLSTALGIEGRLPDFYLVYSQAALVRNASGRVVGLERFAAIVRGSIDRLLRSEPAGQSGCATLKRACDILDSL